MAEEGELPESPIKKQQKTISLIEDYELEHKLGEGTFGEVVMGRKDGSKVALKRIITHNEEEGFPFTAIREIKILKRLKNENVIRLIDIAMKRGDFKNRQQVYMVFPYMDHDLAGILANPVIKLAHSQIKSYMQQVLRGIRYLHQNDIIHRDIKTANILVDNAGWVKLADFGLARDIQVTMTTCVVTLWYRAPELLLADQRKTSQYTNAVDIWGAGYIFLIVRCVFGEMWRRKPLMRAGTELEQLVKIFELLGTPTDKDWPGFKDTYFVTSGNEVKKCVPTLSDLFPSAQYQNETFRLLQNMLQLNPEKRYTAQQALNAKYFDVHPYAAKPGTTEFFKIDVVLKNSRNHMNMISKVPKLIHLLM
jgi:serine/threonine-protein kinase BUR1